MLLSTSWAHCEAVYKRAGVHTISPFWRFSAQVAEIARACGFIQLFGGTGERHKRRSSRSKSPPRLVAQTDFSWTKADRSRMGSRARGRAGTRSLRSAGGAAHSEGAAVDAILAEHPSRIGTGKVLPKSTTDDDGIDGLAPARRSHQLCRTDPRLTLTYRQRASRAWVISI
jgi:hypothetical protein